MLRRLLLIALGALPLPAQQPVKTTLVITARPIDPAFNRRDGEVFEQTLFTRDDQVLHVLNSGINAGQHEGGGKSVEVRRFGFNLDHGGVNGGLKILVDNIQQNQTTQGHGQGYLGLLKSISPELIQEVDILDGPFRAEYGDFSGLGVVHIRLRESFPDEWTARVQGGSFNTLREFLSYSPDRPNTDAFIAYEGSHSDGPFVKPLDYRRDNVTANYTLRRSPSRSFAVKLNGARNRFDSSGQLPLSELDAGRLDRFGYLDPGGGGKVGAGTAALYFHQEQKNGAVWRADGFVSRSLFDLYSNFTFYLNDPVNGDGIQQHDSRLAQGGNVQYARPHHALGGLQQFVAGGNFHANQINVGLYPRVGRDPRGVATRHHAGVTNGGGYAQENLALLGGRLLATAGLRCDVFDFNVQDRVDATGSAREQASRVQPKLGLVFTPTFHLPLVLHANYGRGISSIDARSIAKDPRGTKLATADFYQAGASYTGGRWSAALDSFLIDRSNEMVYIADDGTLELYGPSRGYGYEGKLSIDLTRRLTVSAGVTQVANAFYRATEPRVYVDRAPRFTANAALTLAGWRGWTASLRMRAINHYRLDGLDPSNLAAGHTVWDFSLVRRIRRNLDLNFSADNMLNRSYYETQNYIESRPNPAGPAAYGIHATPGYPATLMIGLTFRFRGK
jgi:hypothetical protein